jgi:hypothetical protein
MRTGARSFITIALAPNLSTWQGLSLIPSLSWGYGWQEQLEPLQRFSGCSTDPLRYPETAKAVRKHPCRLDTPLKPRVNERRTRRVIPFGV